MTNHLGYYKNLNLDQLRDLCEFYSSLKNNDSNKKEHYMSESEICDSLKLFISRFTQLQFHNLKSVAKRKKRAALKKAQNKIKI